MGGRCCSLSHCCGRRLGDLRLSHPARPFTTRRSADLLADCSRPRSTFGQRLEVVPTARWSTFVRPLSNARICWVGEGHSVPVFCGQRKRFVLGSCGGRVTEPGRAPDRRAQTCYRLCAWRHAAVCEWNRIITLTGVWRRTLLHLRAQFGARPELAIFRRVLGMSQRTTTGRKQPVEPRPRRCRLGVCEPDAA